MTLRTTVSVFCGLAIAAGMALTPARADEFNKRTILTVSQTVQIGDAVLQPGQYVIKLLDSQVNRQVVQIFNKDQKHIIATIVTVPLERLEPRGHTTFTFYESPAGTVKAVRSWYYPGDEVGHKFLEPKRHETLAAGVTVEENPLAFGGEAPAETATATQSTDEQTSTAQSSTDTTTAQAATTQSSTEDQSADRQTTESAPAQTEVAQAAPPAPSNDTVQASTSAAQTPAELPHTGSSYPAIGLLGFMLLAMAGLVRGLRRA